MKQLKEVPPNGRCILRGCLVEVGSHLPGYTLCHPVGQGETDVEKQLFLNPDTEVIYEQVSSSPLRTTNVLSFLLSRME